MVAASVPFGATGVFELFFQAIGVSLRGFQWSAYDWFALSLWTVIGLTGLPFWRLTRMFWFWLAATVGGFGAWALVGYPQINWGTGENVPLAYSFAVALKLTAFLVFTMPLIRGIRRAGPPGGRPGMKVFSGDDLS